MVDPTDDFEEQADEIEALQSIFEEEEFVKATSGLSEAFLLQLVVV